MLDLTIALTFAVGAAASWLFNNALDEVSGRFRNFVKTKIKNPEAVFKKVLEETCKKYGINSEEIQSKVRGKELATAKEELRGALEKELPERHHEFLEDFWLKLLDRLSKKDEERMLAGILVDLGLNVKELCDKAARRENLQELKTSLEAYLDSLKKGQEKTFEAISKIKEDTTEIKARFTQIENAIFACPIEKQSELLNKIKTSWMRQFLLPFENALKLQNGKDYIKSIKIFQESTLRVQINCS